MDLPQLGNPITATLTISSFLASSFIPASIHPRSTPVNLTDLLDNLKLDFNISSDVLFSAGCDSFFSVSACENFYVTKMNNGVISNGLSTTPFLIGVAGGTASGKVSSACVMISERSRLIINTVEHR